MKYIVLTVVCLGLGYGWQRGQRANVEDLEIQATVAWNERNLGRAEQQARRAFGINREAARAREVLLRLSDVLQRPEIQLAILLGDREGRGAEQALSEVGRLAMAANWFRLADGFFMDGVRQFPQNEALQRQAVAISGLRLDAEEMQRRLLNWAEHGRPTVDLVVMSLGLWSMDTRGATPSENWLRAALEADSTDLESRLGLARTFLAMGRYRECIRLLADHADEPCAAVLLARAFATTKDSASAAQALPASEPTAMQGDYWFSKGLIAIEQNDWSAAEASLSEAVRLRPLDQAVRARHCAVLRRLNKADVLGAAVQEFDTVVRIAHLSKLPDLATQPESLRELDQMCRSVGAAETAELLSKSLGR